MTREFEQKYYQLDAELMLKTEQNKNFEMVRKSLNDEVTDLTIQLQQKNREIERIEAEFKKFKAKVSEQDKSKQLEEATAQMSAMELEIRSKVRLQQELFEE